MTESTNPCPEPVTCSIAVELANLRGQVCAELAALTANVKALKASSEDAFNRGEKKMTDQGGIAKELDVRVRKLEGKVWWASGAAAGAASAITGAISFAVTYLKLKSGGHGG